VVGPASIFASFALSLGFSLYRGRHDWVGNAESLGRESRPGLFWTLIAINIAFMLLALWHLVEVLRAGRG
jgi:hypothetical protein